MTPIDGNPWRTFCIFGWIALLLIWKNIILLGLLIVFRTRDNEVIVPEDASIFRRQRRTDKQAQKPPPRRVTTTDDWSTANRIERLLSDETEYLPYFLIFALAFCYFTPTSTTRQIVYGSIFVAARYIHNLGLILCSSYPRIVGFLLSIFLLGAMTFDLAINLTVDYLDRN